MRAEEQLVAILREPDRILLEQSRLKGLRYEAAVAVESPEERVRALRAVTDVDPAFLPAAVALGDVLRELGRPRDAARVWIRAASERPEPVVLSRLETLYRELGRPKKVAALYRRLAERSDSPAPLFALVRLFLAEGELDPAGTELDHAAAAFPDEIESRILRGELARRRGQSEVAAETFQSVLDPASGERRLHACASCGQTAGRWTARCPRCGAWNSLSAASAP